jgi:hypothetical protein
MKNLKLRFNPNNERTPLTDENGEDVFHLCTDSQYIAIHRRIVACVNACDGIETNMLELLPMGFKDHARTMDRIAELENCLQETVKNLKEASQLTDNEGSDYTEEYSGVIEKAESVLMRKGPAGILTASNAPTPGQIDISQQAINAFFDSLQPEQKPEILIHRGNTDPSNSGFIGGLIIYRFITACESAMRLLSQNPDDAVAQACVTELKKAISDIMPKYDKPDRFMGFMIKQAEMPPGQIRFESGLPPYNPADLDDF